MKASLSPLKNLLPVHRPGIPACAIALLVLQNIIIFHQHYDGSATFLNDFTRNIYPMIAFWTTLVQHGVFPEWTPFQTMGMPFVLTMQSGVFYLPLWLFAVFKVPFTLHMAVIVQVLHVLWGAIGCWMYARLLGRSQGVALFAAVAFQFFGGFYSNSEHIDIIRAFSYIPWLFWIVHVAPTQQVLVGRNWFAPLIMLLFVTAAYQGNLVSHLFVLGIFLVLSWLSQHLQQKQNRLSVAKLYVQIGGLLALGVLLSSAYLLPTMALKSYLARDGVWAGQTMNWPLGYWNTLIMASNAEGLFVLPSMLSGFVTVPVFCLLFLVSRDFLRQNWLWVCITVFAFMMASGSNLFLYHWMVTLFPPLGSSRFPSSDYRGILCFGLILLASGLLDDYLKGKIQRTLTAAAAWCLGLLLFFYLGNLLAVWSVSAADGPVMHFIKSSKALVFILWHLVMFATGNIISAELSEWPVVIILSALVFLALHVCQREQARMILALLVLEMVSGLYFVNRLSLYWRSEVATDAFYQELDHESPHTVMERINHPVPIRPACHDMNLFNGSWRGYLLGDFMCQTQDSKTKPREVVNANATINTYMRREWQPRLIEEAQLSDCKAETVLSNTAIAPVQSLSYGLQQITYRVNASDNFCFVENELMFPGWSGVSSDAPLRVQPQAWCGALRSWCLPKGDYQFTASYRAPWLREGALVSFLFFMIYIGCFIYWRRTNGKA